MTYLTAILLGLIIWGTVNAIILVTLTTNHVHVKRAQRRYREMVLGRQSIRFHNGGHLY